MEGVNGRCEWEVWRRCECKEVNAHVQPSPPSAGDPAGTVCGNVTGWAGALPNPKGGLENHDINRTAIRNPMTTVTVRPTRPSVSILALGSIDYKATPFHG